MRVSCAQLFAMSPAERELVTHIDMDLDRAQEQRWPKDWRRVAKACNIEPTAEPGTDWTGKDQDQ